MHYSVNKWEQGMVSERAFRELMASVCAPVTVVTAMMDRIPHGATVSSFSSLSLRPPMVSIALDTRSTLLVRILTTRRFGINVLGAGHEGVALSFAKSQADRFRDISWFADHDLPRLTCAVSWVVCDLREIIHAGDHVLLIGAVTSTVSSASPSLIYGNRKFGTHSEPAGSARAVTELIAAFGNREDTP